MEEANVGLIYKILDGDKEAFATLVRMYQKRVHVIAWRKINDYHIAEDITQEAFIQVYENLHTLKNPKQFDGWLYVVVDRLCIDWIKKNRLNTQSLDNTPNETLEEVFYLDYELMHREMETVEDYREIVKKLLNKLPESERTVFTLYHLGDMTAKEVAKTLGISVNTVKSKLRRARKRLRLREKLLLGDTFKGLQLSTDLTENIMKKVDTITPKPPIVIPLLPWTAFCTAVVLFVLTIGIMNQYISHFLQPYNFESLSEPTIEIVESPISIDIVSKPTIRNQVGRNEIDSKNKGVGLQVSEVDSDTNDRNNIVKTLTLGWKQVNGPSGTRVFNIFANSKNNIYALSSTGIYKLTNGSTSWINISPKVPTRTYGVVITEYKDDFYIVNTDTILVSKDECKTWKVFCSRPNGAAIDFRIKEKKPGEQSNTDFVMYLTMQENGIFKSVDAGMHWTSLQNGLTNKRITAVTSIGNSIFVGTSQGLYRMDSEEWKQLSVDPNNAVHSLAVSEENLYVATGSNFLGYDAIKSKSRSSRKIYRSSDLGITWTEITPINKSFLKDVANVNPTKLIARGKTLLVLDSPAYRSRDRGQTWTNLGFETNLRHIVNSLGLAVDEKTFYKVLPHDIHRTTDNGASWHTLMDGIVGAKAQEIVAFNNILYMYTGSKIYKTTTNMKPWKSINLDFGKFMPKFDRRIFPQTQQFINCTFVIVDKSLYLIKPQDEELHIFRLRPGEFVFSMIQKINLSELWTSSVVAKTGLPLDYVEKNRHSKVYQKTVYVKHKNRLFKLDLNSLEFTGTRLTDIAKEYNWNIDRGFKVAASAKIVYVGTQHGKLLQSTDSGNSWREVTPNTLTNFSTIKDIAMVGTTVYVATDYGVIRSKSGEHWHALTDNIGAQVNIDRIAINENEIYGANSTSIYRLDTEGKWEQLSSNVPDAVISLAVNRNRIYVVTERHGIFHTSITEDNPGIQTVKN